MINHDNNNEKSTNGLQDCRNYATVSMYKVRTCMYLICLGPVEFVEPDLAGLLPLSPPPDSAEKRESGSGVNERAKKEGGGNYTVSQKSSHL